MVDNKSLSNEDTPTISSIQSIILNHMRDGTELITNIRIANDRREIDRRQNEAQLRSNLLTDLKNESLQAQEKFDKITERWQNLNLVKDPMGLYEGLEIQKQRMADLMYQKDNMLEQIRKDLLRADEQYYQDLHKQSDDITCIINRIDVQIELMKTVFHKQLENIQNILNDERYEYRANECKKWETLHNKRHETELEHVVQSENFSKASDDILKVSRSRNHEIIHETEQKLENENNNLQVDLQTAKSEILLNAEKLQYNYGILRNRAIENVIVKNQQKKRLCKLHDVVMGIKQKIIEIEQEYKEEERRLTVEIDKLNVNVNELETKAQTFGGINENKYRTLWAINATEANSLFQKILQIDQILFENVLLLPWKISIKKPVNIFSSYDDSYKNRKSSVDRKLAQQSAKSIRKIERKVLKSILEKVAGTSEWLVTEKLDELLDKYREKDRNLIKIDCVFQALEIDSMKNVTKLINYFTPYVLCPNCSETDAHSDSSEIPENVCVDHQPILIETQSVFSVIKQYIEEEHIKINRTNILKVSGRYSATPKTIQQVSAYWKIWNKHFPTKKQSVWQGMERSIQKYLMALKQRQSLQNETHFLMQQNKEFVYLLQKYLPDHSKDDTN